MPSVSQKQANLMSAIKHGWHPPAGVHAPSLAVATEFHEADKRAGKFEHAKGGKVDSIEEALEYLHHVLDTGHGLFGHNSDEYRAILPEKWGRNATEEEAHALMSNATWPLREDNPQFQTLKGLMDKYSLHLPDRLTMLRGFELLPGTSVERLFKRGKELDPLPGPTSVTTNPKIAEDFAKAGVRNGPSVIARIHSDPNLAHYTPNPLSGQDEMMIPDSARYQVDDLTDNGDHWMADIIRTKKADGGKISGLKAALGAIERRLPTASEIGARQGSQLTDAGRDPYNTADYLKQKAAEEAEHAKIIAGLTTPDGYAEGGQVENDAPATNKWLGLISHAADRATATVTDDPHHAAARLAGGAISQWVGLSPQGNPEIGAKPNIINEIKSLPAGMTDIGMAGSNVLGALADKYLPKDNSTGGFASSTLARLRDQINRYVGEHGDPAPKWSRDAEEASNQVHAGVNQAMGLSAPKGWTENLADAGGNMLGQFPLPAGEAKTAARGIQGGLRSIAGAIPEYLGPTIRPSVRNYLTGTVAGGAMGKLGDAPDAPPASPAPPSREPMSDDVIRAYLRAANIRADMDPSQDHTALHNLTDYMDRRERMGAGAGPPPQP